MDRGFSAVRSPSALNYGIEGANALTLAPFSVPKAVSPKIALSFE